MAHEKFLTILQCPYCGGGFELERRQPATGPHVEFGVLRCRCYRYGILLGVAIIRQFSPPHNNEDPVVGHLGKAEYDKAVQFLLAHEMSSATVGRRGKIKEWIAANIFRRMPASGGAAQSQVIAPTEELQVSLTRLRPKFFGEYLYYRHANPSMLAALPVLSILASDVLEEASSRASEVDGEPLWSIDVGCGIGHTAYSMKAFLPQTRMVAADLDFLNLLLAKSYFMSDANFVCLDAEAGLPFRDATFRTAFSLDCVHYIRGKARLASELRRIGRSDAAYAVAHLHNAQRFNPNPGIPLAADGYSKIFEPLNGSIYAETTLLESFCRIGKVSLDQASTEANLQGSDAFTYLSLGKGTADSLSSRRLDSDMARPTSHLALNTLYSPAALGEAKQFRIQWPSQMLRDECCAQFQPLPETVEVAPEVADALLTRRFNALSQEALETLIRSFLVVPQPSGAYLPSPAVI
jgi:SAM-dependent methyltransferase